MEFFGLIGTLWEGFRTKNLKFMFESMGLVPPDVSKFTTDAYDAVKWERFIELKNSQNNDIINVSAETSEISKAVNTSLNMSCNAFTSSNIPCTTRFTNISIGSISSDNTMEKNSSFEHFIREHLSENHKQIS